MILKVLLVVIVIATVYFLFIKKKPETTKKKKNNTKEEKTEIQSDEMVECAECGIYCSLDETILSNNKYYCSQECLEKR